MAIFYEDDTTRREAEIKEYLETKQILNELKKEYEVLNKIKDDYEKIIEQLKQKRDENMEKLMKLIEEEKKLALEEQESLKEDNLDEEKQSTLATLKDINSNKE
uniref:Uncharacterized protein n=1 Tax=Parastrongyloides trichosuri TaxID=131310 RepID=A0A0N5A3E8_PARTI